MHSSGISTDMENTQALENKNGLESAWLRRFWMSCIHLFTSPLRYLFGLYNQHLTDGDLRPTPILVEFVRRGYKEENSNPPQECFLRLILRSQNRKWHVKVTFHGKFPEMEIAPTLSERKADLKSLCLRIDFEQLSRLRDTVTELIISSEVNVLKRHTLPVKPDAGAAEHLVFHIQEDPSQIHYPPYIPAETPVRDWSNISKEQELSADVFKAHVGEDQRPYVYKEIETPLYKPGDTDDLVHELRNLELLRNAETVVQLVAAVVSVNPYQTAVGTDTAGTTVLRGILLDYHPNGTLQTALQSPGPEAGWPWPRWALQIARGLDHIHFHGLTHMDVKPSNIVIGAHNDAFLIDLSGRGITQEWLSPEMQDEDCPWSKDLESWIQNDIWAFGTVLLQMADASSKNEERQLLKRIALRAMAEVPPRTPLAEAISELQLGMQGP